MNVLVLLEGLLVLSALRPWSEAASYPLRRAPVQESAPAPAQPEDCSAALQKADELLAAADEAKATQDANAESELVAEAAQALLAHPPAELGADCVRRLEAIGKRAHESKDFETAIAAREAVVVARPLALPEEPRELQWVRHSLANTLMAQAKYAQARTLLEDVIAVSSVQRSEDDVDVRRARADLAGVLLELGDAAGAQSVYEAVIETLEKLPERPPKEELELCRALTNLGTTLRQTGDLQRAQATFERAIADLQDLGPEGHDSLEKARQGLTWVLVDMGQVQAAHAAETEHLAALERDLPADDPVTLACRLRLAQISTLLGDLKQARALEEHVLEVRERTLPETNRWLQLVRLQLGSTLHELGDIRRSRELIERALTGLEAILPEDHPHVREARTNYAVVLFSDGDFEAARAIQEKLLAQYEVSLTEGHTSLSLARMNLAVTLRRIGDLVRARALLESCLAAQERVLPETSIDLQRTRQNLATILKQQGEHEAARVLEEDVLRILESTLPDDHPDLQASRHNLGRTFLSAGDFEAARSLIEKYLDVVGRSQSSDSFEIQIARLNLAVTLGLEGDLEGELAMERDVLATLLRTRPDDDPYICTTLRALAATLARMGDVDALGPVLDGLLEYADGVVTRAGSLPQREAAELLAWLDKNTDVLLTFDPLLPLEKRRTRSIFALLETLRSATADGRRMADVQGLPEFQPLLTRAQKAADDVSAAVAGSGGNVDRDELLARVRERDEADVAVRRALDQRGFPVARVDPDALASVLEPDSAAVGFRRYARRVIEEPMRKEVAVETLVAFVLRPSGELVRVELGPWQPIATDVERWRGVIGKPIERGLDVPDEDVADELRAGEDLRRRLLDPLLPALGGAQRFHLCPDDSLHLVNFQALPYEEGCVGDRWRVYVESSFARFGGPERARAIGESLVAVGGVGLNADLKREEVGIALASAPPLISGRTRSGPLGTNWDMLPQTRAEAEGLAALFEEVFGKKPVVLTGAAATKRALREQAPAARFLHVATHGYFAPDSIRSLADRASAPVKLSPAAAAKPSEPGLWAPLSASETAVGLAPMTLCGLALAGANRGPDSLGRVPGILTAEELARFDLAGCELAVLSACETNVGATRAGQGISSLRAALHTAGARTAITSLWKVDDEATRALFADFYTRIWVHHEPKAEALWNAMMALKRAGRPTRDWAAWVMTGDPR